MDLITQIAQEAIEHVKADDLQKASDILIEGSQKKEISSNRCSDQIFDYLAFCGLKVAKATEAAAKSAPSKNEYKKSEERIIKAENSLRVYAKEIFSYFHKLDSLPYEGLEARKAPMRRFPQVNSCEKIFAAEKSLLNGETLYKEKWLDILSIAEKQLQYYEGWVPAPRAGLAVYFASRNSGYIKEGEYPAYAKLIQQRKEIEKLIKSAKKTVRKLDKLLIEDEK